MHPPLKIVNVALSPNVVCPVEDEAGLISKSDTNTGKTVGPLSTPAISRFKQLYNTVVSREPSNLFTGTAFVELNSSRHSFNLFLVGLAHTLHRCWRLAKVAWRLVRPLEKVLFVPCEQRFQLSDLFLDIKYIFRNHRKTHSYCQLVIVLLRVTHLALDSIHKSLLLLRVRRDIFALESFDLFGNSFYQRLTHAIVFLTRFL